MGDALSLMVQGTTSDAGKSILVAALCRIFSRREHRVAPFKAQNMALNSAVTPRGGEIGRAQAMQAEAARILPDVNMNPVLLKPNSDIGAQVILKGRAIGNMQADRYHRYKPTLLGEVVESYKTLQETYDTIFIEGAGSPAEINLRDRDIVNMGLAEVIDCPVVIVADIDRGGVFAHLVGTYDLLSPSEKKRIVGFVINRFRGDIDLLTPGIEWLEERLGVPVLAVIPYIEKLYIEAEDAINLSQEKKGTDALSVKVICYPRTSNHTDFDALRMHPNVDCTFIRSAHELTGADLVILPGSKSVRDDLVWLKAQGFDAAINKHLRYGGKVMGVCGGYQMLGQMIHDPEGIESQAGSSAGLGLLTIETCLTDKKILANVKGVLRDTGSPATGYEIHAGVSTGVNQKNALFALTKEGCNQVYLDGDRDAYDQVRGSYLHGLFDEPATLEDLLIWAGLSTHAGFDYQAFRAKEIDRLADAVEVAWPYANIVQCMEQFALT